MLILVRRPGECILVGNDVRVTVLEIRAGQARLGIDAPQNVSVDREEIRLKKIAESQAGKSDQKR